MDGRALSPARVRLIFSGLALALLLAALDQAVVATAMPTIVNELGGLEHIAWVVTAYLAAVIVATPLSGKLGDVYGRRIVFLVSVVIFLVGSVLAGAAQSFEQLIAFRAIQGIGGGGLLTVTIAMAADIVTPRELGRYNGYFGAAFGASSIAGPLVGGFITEQLTWRWIFYLNVPFGLIAMAIIAFAFRVPVHRRDRPFDVLGSGLLAIAVTSVVLLTSWGGTQYAWRSTVILSLAAVAAVATALFIVVERRVADPVLPLGLFRDATFSITSAASLFVGFGMFGAIAFLPLFLQLVHGANPTDSGLLVTPLMLGLLVSALVSGILITKTGRYKIFPIIGPALAATGMYLLSTMDSTTPRSTITFYMVIVGLGVGLCLQVLVLVAQNASRPEELGVTTSSVAFFRTIGGTAGVAVLGAVFADRVRAALAEVLPPGAPITIPQSAGQVPTEALANLPPDLRARYVEAFATALTDAYLWTVPVLVLAAAIALFLPRLPMREHEPAAESPSPTDETDDVKPARPR